MLLYESLLNVMIQPLIQPDPTGARRLAEGFIDPWRFKHIAFPHHVLRKLLEEQFFCERPDFKQLLVYCHPGQAGRLYARPLPPRQGDNDVAGEEGGRARNLTFRMQSSAHHVVRDLFVPGTMKGPANLAD